MRHTENVALKLKCYQYHLVLFATSRIAVACLLPSGLLAKESLYQLPCILSH